jgi:hypothetical protein
MSPSPLLHVHQHASLSVKSIDRSQELLRACESNNFQWITALLILEDKLDPTSQSPFSMSGRESTITNISAADSDGWSSLHWASLHGNNLIIAALLKAGANVAQPTHTGDTALSLAARYGQYSSCLLLLAAKSPINLMNREGFSPLMLACRFNHVMLVASLLAAGAGVTTVSTKTCSLTGGVEDSLSLACKNGHHDVIKLLLAAGAVDCRHRCSFDYRGDEGGGFNTLVNAYQKSRDDSTRSLVHREVNWYCRKHFLVFLCQHDHIEPPSSSFSSATRVTVNMSPPPHLHLGFKLPKAQELVFCNLYSTVLIKLVDRKTDRNRGRKNINIFVRH